MRSPRALRLLRTGVAIAAGTAASGCLTLTHEIWVRSDGSSRVLSAVAFDAKFDLFSRLGGYDVATLRSGMESAARDLGGQPGVRWARSRVDDKAESREFSLEYDVDDVRLLPALTKLVDRSVGGGNEQLTVRVERIGRSEVAIEVVTDLSRGAGWRHAARPVLGESPPELGNDEVVFRIHGPKIQSATSPVAGGRMVEWRFRVVDLLSDTKRAALPVVRAEVDLKPWSRLVIIGSIGVAGLALVGGLVGRHSLSGRGVLALTCVALACGGTGLYAYVASGRIGKPPPPAEPGPPPTTVRPGVALPLTLPPAPSAPATPPPAPVDVARLRSRLQAAELMTRVGALDEVTKLGPRATDVAPDVAAMLADASFVVRARAIRALRATGPSHARDMVPLLSDSVVAVRVEAACALVGTDYAGMTPAMLTNFLAQRDDAIRGRAAECLGDLGPRAAGSVPALMAFVSNTTSAPFVRYHAAAALGRIGSPAVQAIPVLETASQDSSRYVRTAAVEALRLLRTAPSVEP